MKRRGFFTRLLGLAVTPFALKAKPKPKSEQIASGANGPLSDQSRVTMRQFGYGTEYINSPADGYMKWLEKQTPHCWDRK